jgi:hypothetical protein
MEQHIAASTDNRLVSSLSFQLPSVANYIVERTQTTFVPQGGNQYTPTGVRLVRFQLADPVQFLDPSTIRLQFDLLNTTPAPDPVAATPLTLLDSPHVLFQRGRILVNGVQVEDIQYYGRLCTMLRKLQPRNRIADDLIETDWSLPIARGQRKRFMLTLPFGLFNQHLYIWLKVAPLTVELELPLNCMESVQGNAGRVWQIENVQMKVDTVYCDAAFCDQYSQLLLQGSPLPIPIQSYSVQMQSVNQTFDAWSINVNRAFSRLRAVLFTFFGTAVVVNNPTTRTPAVVPANQKRMNHFHHPMCGTDNWDQYDTLEFQMQIGSKTYPQYPVRGLNEAFYRLRQVLGQCTVGQLNIYGTNSYNHTEFIAALDLEKAVSGSGDGAAYSGVSTRGGEQLTLMLKNIPDIAGDGSQRPSEVYLVMLFDALVNVRAEGVEVLM